MLRAKVHALGVLNVAVSHTARLLACWLAGKRQNRKKKIVEAAEMEAVVEGTDEGAILKVTTKKSRAKAESKFPPFGKQARRILQCMPTVKKHVDHPVHIALQFVSTFGTVKMLSAMHYKPFKANHNRNSAS